MPTLRTDLISHSQLTDGNASVLFDGTTDSITIPSTSAFAFGTGDWTVEMFVNFTSLSGQQTLVGDTYGDTAGWYLYKQTSHKLGVYYASSPTVSGNTTIEADRWYHLAFVRHNGITSIFIDGVMDATGADTTDATITQYYIGDTADQTSGEFFGYMSNLRITRTAVYKNNFTVPTFKLKEIPGTILLALQSSSSTTEAAVVIGGSLSANGDPTATAFGPGLKEDIKGEGVVFDGVTNFDTQDYLIPPRGTTSERNRGRGLIMGGAVSPGATNTDIIKYFDVASQGITDTFGNLTDPDGNGRRSLASVSSSTRACTGGGYSHGSSPGTVKNIIDFVTIANTGNATDFGDMQNTAYAYAPASNQTRGLFAGGYQPNNSTVVNTIDLITIATTGNASNFGDLTVRRRALAGLESTTRGVFAGGTFPAVHDEIDFVTFSTTGDATDFGDLTDERDNVRASSSSTRGVMGGGRTPSNTNIIDFITIASTGNAIDFGDLLAATYYYAATGNKTRAVWAGDVSITNTMEFVTIATTGNAVDFGDQNGTPQQYNGCASDSHGGLS